MKIKLGGLLDRLALALRLATIVFKTKDKTVLNKAAYIVDRAKQIKDELEK